MRSDYQERKKKGEGDGKRVMLYVHGGAYFFGSVDEHRYQMQRHARKLKARVFARYISPPFFLTSTVSGGEKTNLCIVSAVIVGVEKTDAYGFFF